MHKYLSKMFISCRKATRLMSEARERELTRRERWGLFWHVLICGMCREADLQITGLEETLRSYPEAMAAARGHSLFDLSVETKERLQEAVRRELA